MNRARATTLRVLAAWLGLCPLSASAHLASTGMGPLYDGFQHFLLSPEDIVPVVALAMFAGLRGPAHARAMFALLPASWFAGCLLGTLTGMTPPSWPLPAISFLVLGGLVATDAQLSIRVIASLAVALGLTHGAMNGAGMRWSLPLLGAYAGLAAAVLVTATLISAFVLRLQRPWMRIVVRVAGSWIVASGLLLLGWSLRRG
jgi:hydrogenase/urease accessory protein HupE